MAPQPITRNEVHYHQSRLQRVALVAAQYMLQAPARQYTFFSAITVLVSLRTKRSQIRRRETN